MRGVTMNKVVPQSYGKSTVPVLRYELTPPPRSLAVPPPAAAQPVRMPPEMTDARVCPRLAAFRLGHRPWRILEFHGRMLTDQEYPGTSDAVAEWRTILVGDQQEFCHLAFQPPMDLMIQWPVQFPRLLQEMNAWSTRYFGLTSTSQPLLVDPTSTFHQAIKRSPASASPLLDWHDLGRAFGLWEYQETLNRLDKPEIWDDPVRALKTLRFGTVADRVGQMTLAETKGLRLLELLRDLGQSNLVNQERELRIQLLETTQTEWLTHPMNCPPPDLPMDWDPHRLIFGRIVRDIRSRIEEHLWKSRIHVLPRVVPIWMSQGGQLYWNGHQVMDVRGGENSLRTVLDQFQQQGWPDRISNPFAADADKLKEAKKQLNAKLRVYPLCFRIEKGGIAWGV